MEASEGLRERKKAATRLALHRAVTELAAAKGLDAVTVDAIADHANVSRRTFSNYFASKEEALLYGDQLRFEELLRTVRERPAGETPWQALTRSARVLLADLGTVDPVWLAQMRLVYKHPSLAAYQVAAQSTVERELANEIEARAARTGGAADALHARVLAAVFFATLRAAVRVWIEHPDDRTVSDTVTAAFAAAAERLR
jgi:AcrR family transcriptional regulator